MKIKFKLVISFLVVSMIPIIFIGVSSFYKSKSVLKKTVLNSLEAVTDLKEVEISLYRQKLETRTEDFSLDAFIIEKVKKINSLSNPSEELIDSLNKYLIENKKSLDDSIIAIDILDLEGKIISSTLSSRIGQNQSEGNSFIYGQEKVYIDDIYRGRDGFLKTMIGAPLFDPNSEELIGVIINCFDSEEIDEIMSGHFGVGDLIQARGLGETGETYLVNKDYLMLNNSLFIEDSVLNQEVDTYPVRKCFQEMQEVNGLWLDYRGVPVFGASICLDFGNFRWALISEQDEEEAFSGVNQLKSANIILGVLIFFLSLGLAFLMGGLVVKPIQKLIDGVKIIRRGNWMHKIKINSKDEIGRLADNFNDMTKDLAISKSDLEEKNVELAEKIKQIEKINKSMVGRELKMIELKRELLKFKNKKL